MPVYEYFCHRCEKGFTETMHVEEHERDVPECPECHRKDEVERRLSTFSAVTTHKSAGF